MAAAALLCGLYAQGGALWPLGFVALVPWLLALDATRGWRATLLQGYAMTLAFSAAVLPWFGTAIGAYVGIGEAAGFALLLVAAPLLQPQILTFVLVRRLAAEKHGTALRAGAAAAAWLAAEAFWPKLLGDTLGHGLYPAALLRQSAEYGGAAGLTLMLLLANEAVAAAWTCRAAGPRTWALPLALAVLAPLLLAAGGAVALHREEPAAGPSLRMGLVQSAIVDYERLRREKGAGAVVREVLDVHYAMSYDAVERQRVQAVMWSETVYPTTFGHPKSEAGAELDREIQGIVDAARVPFVFGTYDRDTAGEYNAAAFLAPGSGLVGLYRKARPFPITEHVPAWLDGPLLREALPWAGNWLPGTGARVFPLRLADGREVPVLPLICLDDTDAGLAVDGARLGAMLILTMSNDAWFTQHPLGAELHLAVAAFRSIETRLPQFRVTSNGMSAVIDATGRVLAGSRMGERTLVVGELPVREPRRTLFVAWGDWVGRAAAAALLMLLAAAALRRAWRQPRVEAAAMASGAFEADVALLPPRLRPAIAALRVIAGAAVAWIAASLLAPDGGWLSPAWPQIRVAAVFVLAPSLIASLLLKAHAARLRIDGAHLLVLRGPERIELPVAEVAAVHAWRLPLPAAGVSLRLAGGSAWRWQLAGADAVALQRALAAAGSAAAAPEPAWAAAQAQARLACRPGWFGTPAAKFALLPLVLALPAFRLHQQIVYGSPFGEALASGGWAYVLGLAGWWAAWAVGVLLVAALLRVLIEAGCAAAALLRPVHATAARFALERAGLVVLYLGLPAWLAWRMLMA